MNNRTTTLAKILGVALPVFLAILLAGGVTYGLGLWGQTTNPLNQVLNKIQGTKDTTPVSALKIGLPYNYKGAPQTYTATVETVRLQADFANPNLSENVTQNLEVRAYKFTKVVAGSGDLAKGATFDEATLRQAFNKVAGTAELDLYPVFSKEFKGTMFTPNETKTLGVEFNPTEAGYYAVIFATSDYFATGNGPHTAGFIRVVPNNGTTTPTKSSPSSKTIAPAAAPTTKTLPATGGVSDILTAIASLFTAAALKLRSKIKK